jgi:hypothetical protein
MAAASDLGNGLFVALTLVFVCLLASLLLQL